MLSPNSIGRWVTMNGNRVFIDSDGEVRFAAYFNAKRSREKYQKHVKDKKEFGDITIEQYVYNATKLSWKTEDVETLKTSDGKEYKYDLKENELLVIKDNRVLTYFKPECGVDYWERQKLKYKK